jgi:hypothetical protein
MNKTSFIFFFIFALFFSAKSKNRRLEQVLLRREGWHECEGGR